MNFIDPLSIADQNRLAGKDIAVVKNLDDLTVGTPLERMSAESIATEKLLIGYIAYRLNRTKGRPSFLNILNSIAEEIKTDLGPNRGAEAIRVIVKAIDYSIEEALAGGGPTRSSPGRS